MQVIFIRFPSCLYAHFFIYLIIIFVVESKAKAESEQMAKKAEAFKLYNEAALVDMLMQSLPKVKTNTLQTKCGPH